MMIAGRGVHCALQAANATGSDCAVDHVSANDSAEPDLNTCMVERAHQAIDQRAVAAERAE